MRSAEHGRDFSELLLDVFAVRLGEDGADDRGDHLLRSFRDHGEDVAHKVHPAALPAGALEHGPDGLLQAGVRVRHNQLDPAEAAGLQRPKEAGPKALVLAVTNVESEDFPAPVGSHADRDDNGLGHDPVPDAGLAVGRVEEHVREVLGGEGAVAKLGHLSVQARADPGHLRLRDPRVRHEGLDQVVDFAGRDAVDVGLHHDREQGLVHPAAALQQCREERPGAQLEDLQIKVPGRR